MNRFGIKTEFEAISGFILDLKRTPKKQDLYELRKKVTGTTAALRKDMREKFFGHGNNKLSVLNKKSLILSLIDSILLFWTCVL